MTLTQARNRRITKRKLLGVTMPSSVLVILHARHQNDAVVTTSALIFGYTTDDTDLLATTL
ncbi:MAG: hypothetical protein VB674_09790 [Vicinamibacterales bacterium]